MSVSREPKRGVKRRTVLRGLATGLAGAVAAPQVSPVAGASAAAQDASTEEVTSLGVLTGHDREVLVSLCETLVPGSVEAGVPDLMDRVADVETTESQRALLASLRAFEAEARAKHAASWIELDEASRTAILSDASSGSANALREHFVRLRAAVAETYFATEPGMRKLGWTPRSAWRELPRCEHPGDDHR